MCAIVHGGVQITTENVQCTRSRWQRFTQPAEKVEALPPTPCRRINIVHKNGREAGDGEKEREKA